MPRVTHVVDTSAIIVLLRMEQGYDRFEALLKDRENYFAMHIVNLGELFYVFYRSDGEARAVEAWNRTEALPIQVVSDVTDGFVKRVGRWKATQRIAYADAYALATAEDIRVPLVTVDHREFDPIEAAGLLQFVWLR